MMALSRTSRVGLACWVLLLAACTSSSPGPTTTVDAPDVFVDIDTQEDDTPDATSVDVPLDERLDAVLRDVFTDQRDARVDASLDRVGDAASDLLLRDDTPDSAPDVFFDLPVDTTTSDDATIDAGPPDDGPIDTGPVDAGSCDCATEMNARIACVAGLCQSTCDSAFARCGGACVTASASQCGADCHACDVVPHGTPACVDGRCVNVCETGYFACPDGCCLFHEERVAPERMGGEYPGLAIGADGNDQLLYSNTTESMLMYAHLVGGIWQRERVQPSAFSTSTSNFFRFVIGASGEPSYIIHDINIDSRLTFGHRTSSGWLFENLVSDNVVAADLVSDVFGRLHVCYARELGGFGYAVRRGDQWFHVQLEPRSELVSGCAVTTDARGVAHVAWQNNRRGMFYATGSDAGFSPPEVIERVITMAYHPAIAISPSGILAVAYTTSTADGTYNYVKYATRSAPDSWSTRVAVSGGAIPSYWHRALAFDNAGRAVLTYRYGDSPIARYAVLEGDTWSLRQFPMHIPPNSADIQRTPSGEVHVALGMQSGEVYTGNVGATSVSTALIDEPLSTDYLISIALRGSSPVIAYIQGRIESPSDGGLHVAERDAAGTWRISRPSPGESADAPSLAVDARGELHMAWHGLASSDLRYGHRATDGTWTLETVASTGDVGRAPSLALDSRGQPHIVYWDVSMGTVGYAERVDGAWRTTTIARPSTTGGSARPMLKIGPDDVPHIIWFDGGPSDLMYATLRAGAWRTSAIETAGTSGTFHGLAVDAAGNPRVCYSRIAPGAANYELRYGTLDALGWTLETIPRSGERALGPCVPAVDAAGRTRALTMYWWGLASSALRLSTRTATGWTHADVSRALSIVDVQFALDASGRAHIARESTLDISEPRYIDYLSQ